MEDCEIFSVFLVLIILLTNMVVTALSQPVPTTLEGPFKPVTRSFDPSLRRGSDDLPMDHPRLTKNVSSDFPEQIALALSAPTSMWVSWVTGNDPFVFLSFRINFFFLELFDLLFLLV